MDSTNLRRPTLHAVIHEASPSKKRPREVEPPEENDSEDDIWISGDETEDDSDYSVYSDEEDSDSFE